MVQQMRKKCLEGEGVPENREDIQKHNALGS
jgi:hypothetical protein